MSRKDKVNLTLEDMLNQKGLVHTAPNPKNILRKLKNSKNEITVFYGETYDEAGNTVDSMKYYLFVALASDIIRKLGYNAVPKILIADVAACRNVSKTKVPRYMELGENRAKFVRKVSNTYNLGLKVEKMSDFIDSEDFQKKVNFIKELCENDSKLMNMVEKSVPPSKVDIEREKGFAYSFDEIAAVIDIDLKIGPPREELYDSVARKISKLTGRKNKLTSIFLTPTYPLGFNWDYFFAYEDLESYGITAYKGDSKQLRGHRILVGRTTVDYAKELIEKSYVPTKINIPNPVLDIGIISEMAEQRLNGQLEPLKIYDNFYNHNISSEQLKNYVFNNLKENVLDKV